MKLLVIDDNLALIKSLKDFLGEDFVIDYATTARTGLEQAVAATNDIIILDISLPDGLGSDVCREIRAAKITTPIIVLSAAADIRSRVELLGLGADDYLIKPFSLLELRARLFALIRRAGDGEHGGTVLKAGDLVMDLGTRRVQRAGNEIKLRRKEFDILTYLMRNRGQTVTRTMIFDHAWESNKDCWHNTIDVHIKHLRDKVDRPFSEPLIKTAYGIGYVLDDISSNIIERSTHG